MVFKHHYQSPLTITMDIILLFMDITMEITINHHYGYHYGYHRHHWEGHHIFQT